MFRALLISRHPLRVASLCFCYLAHCWGSPPSSLPCFLLLWWYLPFPFFFSCNLWIYHRWCCFPLFLSQSASCSQLLLISLISPPCLLPGPLLIPPQFHPLTVFPFISLSPLLESTPKAPLAPPYPLQGWVTWHLQHGLPALLIPVWLDHQHLSMLERRPPWSLLSHTFSFLYLYIKWRGNWLDVFGSVHK